MEHLLSVWTDIANRLRKARHILLLTDFDGTLAPIVERPELVNLSSDMKLMLKGLSHWRRLTLGIISGRALADLKERVGISGIIYAGNHGLEIEGPGISFVNPVAEDFRPVLSALHHVLSHALQTIKGTFVENKGLTLSVHYRQAGEHQAGEVEKIVKNIVGGAEAAGRAQITQGKKVYEVRPIVTWDKGKAIKLLMKKYGKGGRKSGLFPIYIGDDFTDEAGFKVIEAYGAGLSIFVGGQAQHSSAGYFLESTVEVAAFLRLLLELAMKGPG